MPPYQKQSRVFAPRMQSFWNHVVRQVPVYSALIRRQGVGVLHPKECALTLIKLRNQYKLRHMDYYRARANTYYQEKGWNSLHGGSRRLD